MKTVKANHDGWSDWIAPNPNGYLMVCCDCHLAHDIEFCVVEKEDRDDGSWEHGEPLDSDKFRTIFRVRRNNRSTARFRNSAAAPLKDIRGCRVTPGIVLRRTSGEMSEGGDKLPPTDGTSTTPSSKLAKPVLCPNCNSWWGTGWICRCGYNAGNEAQHVELG